MLPRIAQKWLFGDPGAMAIAHLQEPGPGADVGRNSLLLKKIMRSASSPGCDSTSSFG